MMTMMTSVEPITPEQTRALRHLVLWPHKASVTDCVIDIDHRPDALHLGAFTDGRIIGVCSMFEMSTPKLRHSAQQRLRAMATHPDFRGHRAGQALVREALNQAQKRGADVLWCDARAVALGFYEKLGFKTLDEWYEVPIIGPHKLMYFEF